MSILGKLSLMALLLLAACGPARSKPLITGGTGGMSMQRAIEQMNIEDIKEAEETPATEQLPEEKPAMPAPPVP